MYKKNKHKQLRCKLTKGIVLDVILEPNTWFVKQVDVFGINPIILRFISQGLK